MTAYYMRLRWTVYICLLVFGIGLNIKQIYGGPIRYITLMNQNIVVSMTTTPHRIDRIQKTLDTVLSQTAPIKKIYLSIPYRFKRDNLEYKIPKWLQDNKKITILRTKDYGPATKLLGLLEQVDLPPDTIIVTLDDDIMYPKGLVLQLAHRARQYPHYAITILGANPEYDDQGNVSIKSVRGLINDHNDKSFVAVAQGFAGIAYRRSFFDSTIFDIVNAPQECINSDDLYLSFYLAKHNIPRQTLNDSLASYKQVLPDQVGLEADALHAQAIKETQRHRTCIAYMKQKDPEVIF